MRAKGADRSAPFHFSSPMTTKQNWERGIDAVLGIAASVLLFGMMVLTFVDVVARYLLNRPIRGAFEVTELDAAGADLRRPAAGVARRRARHDGLHRPHAARRPCARLDPRRARGLRRDHVLPRLAGLDQGRNDRRLRRHHRRAAHPHRAVRLLHGRDDRASRASCTCYKIFVPGRRRANQATT